MDISKITDYLYVGTQPKDIGAYGVLHDLGITLIINMRAEHEPRDDPLSPPIETIWLETHDRPSEPIPIKVFFEGVEKALFAMEAGGKIFVHCAGGRHTHVAMAAAILIVKGHSAQSAMELLKSQRPEADPEAEHIRQRIEEFERRLKEREEDG